MTNPTEQNISDFREELLDTLYISSEEEIKTEQIPYRKTAKMSYDILHTRLELGFDWEKQHVLGKANITLTPYFYPIQEVVLDAVNFDLHEVKILPENQKATFTYDGNSINIQLPKFYEKGEKIEVFIHYTAKPEDTKDFEGEAITSDKGLFFINPLGKEKNKPKQIWTQGETENNKNWFPTFDKPNERSSQEIILTVEDKYLTLSNGKLISSRKNADGTRTDHWKQELSHAPYLFMLAVGEFHEEKEMWGDVPLHYFVEKGFERSAKKIFNHTPEMLGFFSDKLNYSYPWDKYAQIVVRDFVSGAMENTGAVVFGEFVQKSERELIDNENDYIVAHELMHHWFGNLVTLEEWSNLTLNEGFANYAEYLWLEYKYGKEKADYHRLTELNGYFSQVYSQGPHPLVDYYYKNKEDMFDAHSYNKGGLVLHMLREYVGDNAFYKALHHYLKTHAFTSVEVDELRMAFEDTIGEDLHWFFDQWYLKSGHPTFDVNYQYQENGKSLKISVRQTQDSLVFPSCFVVPLNVHAYFGQGNMKAYSFMMDKRAQDFYIEFMEEKPLSVVFDGKNTILGLINENKTQEEYVNQYLLSPYLGDKMIALSNIQEKDQIIDSLLQEKFFVLRSAGIEAIPENKIGQYVSKLQEMVLFDPHSQVRLSALQALLAFTEEEVTTILKRIVEAEQVYPVLSLALEALSYYDQATAETYADKLKNDQAAEMVNSVSTVYANSGKPEYLEYFHNQLSKITIYQLFDFFENYHLYLDNLPAENWQGPIDKMYELATDEQEDPFFRYFGMSSLLKLNEFAKTQTGGLFTEYERQLKEKIVLVKEWEKDPFLIERYSEIK